MMAEEEVEAIWHMQVMSKPNDTNMTAVDEPRTARFSAINTTNARKSRRLEAVSNDLAGDSNHTTIIEVSSRLFPITCARVNCYSVHRHAAEGVHHHGGRIRAVGDGDELQVRQRERYCATY